MFVVSECPAGMFRCNDGLCLDNKRRCDGRPQCSDGSDEINCRTIATFLNLSACLFFIYRSKLIRIAGYAISIDSNEIGPLVINGRYRNTIWESSRGKLIYQWFSFLMSQIFNQISEKFFLIVLFLYDFG